MAKNVKLDSEAVHRAAVRVQRTSESVQSLSRGDMSRLMNSLDGSFEGAAATALNEQLTNLRSDLNSMSSALSEIAGSLYAYERWIRWVDEQAKQIVGSEGGG